MNIYYTALNLLILVALAVMIRYGWHRFRYFLQMFQQSGYKLNEYREWLSRNLLHRAITPEHFWLLVVITVLQYFTSSSITATAAALILGMFILFWFGKAGEFRPEREKKPLVYTSRMKRLSLLLAVLVLLPLLAVLDLSFSGRLLNSSIGLKGTAHHILIADPWFLFFGLVFTDLLIPFLLPLAALFMKPVESGIHKGFMRKARKRLADLPNLRVIAITGSYGKTSVKYMIDTLLKERYSVCKTPGSYNTPMGICKVINNDLGSHHQVLILEMGARYEGNIAELCGITKPDIAMVTNVGVAHLETFGSKEVIAREKSTLARELKPGGTLVLNSDDEIVSSWASLRNDVEVVMAGLNGGSVQARDIEHDAEGTRFDMQWQETDGSYSSHEVRIKLLGRHNVCNFLLAAATAQAMGLRPETVALAAGRIEPVPHRLELKRLNGIIVIDDAFNSNPTGAANALEALTSIGSGRKILITPGMIELGTEQERENRDFGQKIAAAKPDLVLLVGREQTNPILEGIREKGGDGIDVRIVSSLFEANELLSGYAAPGDVVLYENDLPDSFNE
ncbi:MAG: UDP-N-acetylmuramoyl-tripeptide--D-alanyl-D-alanine ligase [Balneolaceae bacterium]